MVVALTSLSTAMVRLPSGVTPRTEPRVASLAALRSPESIDSFAGIDEAAWPKSRHPVGGFAFVRCTNLWTAHADGSGPRRILSMPGISSPTFSPDGRTIAFLAATATGTDIWLAAADGSATRRLGTIAEDGDPVLSGVGPLEWSPDGSRLAFTVRPAGIRGGTTAHWLLSLDSGMFEPAGEGGDEPVWLERQVLVAGRSEGEVEQLWGERWTAKRLSKVGDIQAVAFAPGWWAWEWEKQTAMLVEDGAGTLSLSWQKRPYATGSAFTAEAPPGFRFDPSGRLAVLQHGTVAATLIDEDGERDLGLFDPATLAWTTLDYAWDASGSPAPAAVGTIEEQRVVQLAHELLWSLGRRDPTRADLLLLQPLEGDLGLFRHLGYTIGEPVRVGDVWSIPAHTYGRIDESIGTRDIVVSIRAVDGRLAATVDHIGPIVPLRTVRDAVRFLDRVLTVPVLAPAGLPQGTVLAGRAIDAWSWRGRSTGSLHVIAPGLGRLSFYYGDGSLGCGTYPVPLELATGTPAIIQDPDMSGGYNAIAWPAGRNDSSGPFGIWGRVSPEELVAIGSAMDASRPPARLTQATGSGPAGAAT